MKTASLPLQGIFSTFLFHVLYRIFGVIYATKLYRVNLFFNDEVMATICIRWTTCAKIADGNDSRSSIDTEEKQECVLHIR